MSDSGSDDEIRCNACGFEASYVPEGMLPCERCRDVYYCSIHCLQWDWKSGGHEKVCKKVPKDSASDEADVQPLQNTEATQTDAREESGSVEWVEEEVSLSSGDSATLMSMDVGQVFNQQSQQADTASSRSDNPSKDKGSLGAYLTSVTPTKTPKGPILAPPPPPPVSVEADPGEEETSMSDEQFQQEGGQLDDSIQQDTLFEEEIYESDQETADEVLTSITEEDSKMFQGEPDHEGSWRARDHFKVTKPALAKPALGTLGITEEVDSEADSVDFFGNKRTPNKEQVSITSSDNDFFQGDYNQDGVDQSSSSSGSSDGNSAEDLNEDQEMEMLENVDTYMEAAAATPSKRSATDDKSNIDAKRVKEQVKAKSTVGTDDAQEEAQQVEAANTEKSSSRRLSYKDFRASYTATSTSTAETSTTLKKFRELYTSEEFIREDEQTLTSIRSIEKEMESISADSTEDAIAAKKEVLKKSINTALRDLEKIHGEEAAQAIFLRLTQSLDGIDTEMLSKELSEPGSTDKAKEKGSSSSRNSNGSGNMSGNEENNGLGPQGFKQTLFPSGPSPISGDNNKTMENGAASENNSTSIASKEERPSAIPRYMQYRASLSSHDRASREDSQSQSSSQVSNAFTPDTGTSSSSLPSSSSRPSSIPRYMQYRSALAKDMTARPVADKVETKGSDADTAAGVAVVVKDKENPGQNVEAVGIPRYMQYRNSLRESKTDDSLSVDKPAPATSSSGAPAYSNACAPFVGDIGDFSENMQEDQAATSDTAGEEAPGNLGAKLAESQSTFVPRFMQYRASFNREPVQSPQTLESTEPAIQPRVTLSSDDGKGMAPVSARSMSEPEASSLPRYMQYRNSLAKNTTPVNSKEEEEEAAGAHGTVASGIVPVSSVSDNEKVIAPVSAVSESQTSSMPRYMQYRNTLAKNSGSNVPVPVPEHGGIDSQPATLLEDHSNKNSRLLANSESSSEEDPDESSTGSVSVAAVSAVADAAAATAVASITSNNASSETAPSVLRSTAQEPVQSGPTISPEDELVAQALNRQRIAATIKKAMSQYKGNSGRPKLEQDEEQLKTQSVQVLAPTKEVVKSEVSISPPMQFCNTLAQNTGSTATAPENPFVDNKSLSREDSNKTTGTVAASKSDSFAGAVGTTAVMSATDYDRTMAPFSAESEPVAPSMPRYMQYRNMLAKNTTSIGSKEEEKEGALSTPSGIVSATSTSANDRVMAPVQTEAGPSSVPRYMQYRNSLAKNTTPVNSKEEEEATGAHGTVASGVVPVSSISDNDKVIAPVSAVSESQTSSMPRYMQYRNTLAKNSGSNVPVPVPEHGGIESQPATLLEDRSNKNSRLLADSESSSEEDPDESSTGSVSVAAVSAVADAAAATAVVSNTSNNASSETAPSVLRSTAQEPVQSGPTISPEDELAAQALNRQRIAATIKKAMSQYKGNTESPKLEQVEEQVKTKPIQVHVPTKDVVKSEDAVSPPSPTLSKQASGSSPPPPPQKAAPILVPLAEPSENSEKSDNQNESAARNRRQFLLYGALCLFLVIAPLSIGLGVTQRNKDSRPLILDTESPTAAPNLFPVSDAPSPFLRTRAPAVSPAPATPSPSLLEQTPTPAGSPIISSDSPTVPTLGPTSTFNPTREPMRAELFQLLSSVSSDDGTNMATPGTAQNDAFNWLANDPNVTTFQDQRLIQRYSLATFYYSTNGGSWTSSEGWLSDQDECLWFTRSTRIPVCDQNGFFRNLDLGFNEVGGSIPTELALLSNLLRLELSGGTTQRITGSIPSELGLLTRIVSFDVFGNALTGTIPPELAAWTSAESVNLGFNRLSGSLPDTFGSMDSLIELDCGLNSLTGSIPSTFSNLSRLEKLLLNNNRLSGNLDIGDLSELRELNVGGNAFTSVDSSIGQLTNLQTLRLNDNSFTGPILDNFGNLISLITFDMSRNQLTGEIPTQIGMLSNLRNLYLSANSLEGAIPTQIGMLSRLLNLLLQSNNLTGPIPDEVSQLERLTTIRLEDNAIQGALSDIVCDAFTVTRPIFYLDCGGDSPEVTCPEGSECCTFCCSSEGGCQCEFEGTSSEFLCG